MDHLPIILMLPVPNKVPGSPLLMSLHSITNPFKLGFAVMLSVDVGHDPPMGLLLATLRYRPHVPLDDEAGGAHGAVCAKAMKLELLGHMFSVVKSHLVVEVVPVTVQVHLVTVPGQRGWEMLESHERVWARPVYTEVVT